MSGPKHWARAELRLAERYARALVDGEYRSASQAAARAESDFELLHRNHPEQEWARQPRTHVAIYSRIAKLAHRTRARWSGLKWTRGEDLVIARYVRDVAAGRYRLVRDAAIACREEFRRLSRQAPKPAWLNPGRSQVAVYNHMLQQVRRQGARPRRGKWLPEESRVLDTYAKALARGKFRLAGDALADLSEEMERLRKRYPDARWLNVKRTPGALLRMLRIRARKLGRPWRSVAWSPAERRLLGYYARGVLDRTYADSANAARAMLQHMARLRRRRPRPEGFEVTRTFKAAKAMLWERARLLGRPAVAVPWANEEYRIVDRYGRALGRGQYRDLNHAAKAAVDDLARLHQANPGRPWSKVRRTWLAIRLKMWYRTRDLGLLWTDKQWTGPEDRILDRYARLFMAGRYRKMKSAAQDCHRELARHYARIQQRRFGRPWSPQPRSRIVVYERLRLRTSALGRPRIVTAWRPAEMRLARKWAQRSASPSPAVTSLEASRRLRLELKHAGFDRGRWACRAQIFAVRAAGKKNSGRNASR